MTYFEHESNVSCCPNCPVKVEVCYIVPARYLRMILMILMMIRMKNTGSRLLMHHKGFWNLKLNHLDFVRFVFSYYLTISSTWARSILITFIFITRLDRCKSFHHFPQCHHNYVLILTICLWNYKVLVIATWQLLMSSNVSSVLKNQMVNNDHNWFFYFQSW